MASYVANDDARKTVTLVLSKSEANALRDAALFAEASIAEGSLPMKHATAKAYSRATSVLTASTNQSARRAGFFD